ncbi:hypothetical protein K439DRAFT_1637034 [Ramaria rubella]|nr:hypothetical protein K439DRAFT_1637034 [Ramaria rubella]
MVLDGIYLVLVGPDFITPLDPTPSPSHLLRSTSSPPTSPSPPPSLTRKRDHEHTPIRTPSIP